MTTTVNSTLASVNIDCADSAGLADFWGKALGRPVSPGKAPGIMVVGELDPGSQVNYPQLRLTQLADPEGNLFNLATWQSE